MKVKNKVELLAPAGDLNRGKIAFDFGADAIYFGGQAYSLRARASNFTLENIHEISEYAHYRNRKIYLVINVLNQNGMLGGFEEYFKKALEAKPDAFIVSDPYIIKKVKEIYPEAQIHISTQQSISNYKASLFFARNGCSRIILSREVNFNELKGLIEGVDGKIEIETFIHGAVCIAYSGRCMLSSNFCLRDANIGGCAQCCRWEMKLSDESGKVYSNNFTMSAKDMCLATKIDELINVGVSSFKIEGRMKNEHYIATVVNDYRNLIENHYSGNKDNTQYLEDIANVANRETDLAWYDGQPGIDKMLYHEIPKQVKQNYAFIVTKKINNNTYEVITKNKIQTTDNFQILSPLHSNILNINISKMFVDGVETNVVSAPASTIIVEFAKDIELQKNDIGRII